MANAINNIKVTVGKEAIAGNAVTPTAVLPISGPPSIDKKATNEKDPVIVGSNMASGKIMTSFDVSGSIPLSYRPCTAVGLALKSLLGSEATPQQIGGLVAIKYTGSEGSCKITASNSLGTITSEIGDKGSEAVDSNFGTTGLIDLTDTATDTIDELVSVINGYSDYTAKKMFEEVADYDTSNILDITSAKQGKDTYVLIWFGSSTSGVYKHTFTPDLENNERDTLSIQKDGYQDNFLYDGSVIDGWSFSGSLKGFVESDLEVLGFSETGGQTASVLELEDRDPVAFSNGFTSIGSEDVTYISSMSLSIKNNHNTEGYGQGSLGRVYHSKSTFEATGDVQIRLDASTYPFRDYAFNSDTTSFTFEYKGGLLSGGVPEATYIELPYCGIIEPDFPDSNGVFDLKLGYEAYKPKGTTYNEPLSITILTTDSGAY